MGLIHVFKNVFAKIIETIKPKEEFTNEDFYQLEKKKTGSALLKNGERTSYGPGPMYRAHHRLW